MSFNRISEVNVLKTQPRENKVKKKSWVSRRHQNQEYEARDQVWKKTKIFDSNKEVTGISGENVPEALNGAGDTRSASQYLLLVW